MRLLLLPLLAAGLSLWPGCTTQENAGNPLSSLGFVGRDTILLDTLIYYRDTLRFTQNVARSGGGGANVTWVICQPCDTAHLGEGFTFSPKSAADTLYKEAYGFVSYGNGAVDTYRVIINIRAGWPTVSLNTPGSVVIQDLDAPLTLHAQATDENGAIEGYYWDLGAGAGFENRNLDSLQTLSFFLPASYWMRVRVRDDDSLYSLPDSVRVDVVPLHDDTMIYIYDTLAMSLSPQPGKTVDKSVWIDWPDDTVGTGLNLLYSNKTAADTGRRAVVGFISYTDQSVDTQRVIVHINAALPKIALTLFSGLPAQTYYTGIPYLLSAAASDANGAVSAIAWDIDGDGLFEKSGVETTAVALWTTFEPHVVRVRARDNDSLWSPAETLSLNLEFPVADLKIYYLDTLKLTLTPNLSKTVQSAQWVEWLGDTLAAQAVLSLPITALADTGIKLYHGLIRYSDNSVDTNRSLVEIKSGIPRIIYLNLAPNDGTNTVCCLDSAVGFQVQASDENGKIKGFEWDLNEDGIFERARPDSASTGTDSLSYFPAAADTYIVRVRAWDDDSLFSPVDTLRFILKP